MRILRFLVSHLHTRRVSCSSPTWQTLFCQMHFQNDWWKITARKLNWFGWHCILTAWMENAIGTFLFEMIIFKFHKGKWSRKRKSYCRKLMSARNTLTKWLTGWAKIWQAHWLFFEFVMHRLRLTTMSCTRTSFTCVRQCSFWVRWAECGWPSLQGANEVGRQTLRPKPHTRKTRIHRHAGPLLSNDKYLLVNLMWDWNLVRKPFGSY